MKNSDLTPEITFKEAAHLLSVSQASIRNWVKSGELTLSRPQYVTQNSLKTFQNTIAGHTRLLARANKLYTDTQQNSPLPSSNTSALDLQSDQYETGLGEAKRNQNGVYYTPPALIDLMLSKIPGDVSQLTFLDPCCGSGNFLLGALRRGFKAENIYGIECDADALELAKKRLDVASDTDFNTLVCGDFLTDVDGFPQKFDVVATNPPWGRKYNALEKKAFAKAFSKGAVMGSAALFSLAALERVKAGGHLSLLLPESCFNIGAFAPLRQAFLAQSVLSLENHSRPFKSLMTEAVSILVQKTPPKRDAEVNCKADGPFSLRSQNSFSKLPKTIFNPHVSPKDQAVVEHCFAQAHILLNTQTSWGLGIVTGGNKTHCRAAPLAGDVPIFRGADITKDRLKPPSLFLNPELSRYRQVAPKALYVAPEKLIYKFISQRLVFYRDTQQRLILNSANLLVLGQGFPLTHAQLCFLLNSDLMNFLFQAIFRTRKVLRSDLEALPIFHLFFTTGVEMTEENLTEYVGLSKTQDGYRLR